VGAAILLQEGKEKTKFVQNWVEQYHNHSHLILLEDQDQGNNSDAVIALRGEFEKCLGALPAKHTWQSDHSGEEEQHPVPVVSICGTVPCN